MSLFGLFFLKQNSRLHSLPGVCVCVSAQACGGGKRGGRERVCADRPGPKVRVILGGTRLALLPRLLPFGLSQSSVILGSA